APPDSCFLLRPPPPPRSPLFPYTTLFRSQEGRRTCERAQRRRARVRRVGEGAHVHARHAQVGRHAHGGHGQLAQPRVVRLAQERSEEHTSELQSRFDLVCRLLLEKKKK